MHCGSCVALVEESLAEQDGVDSASVDLDRERAVIGFDPSVVGVDELRGCGRGGRVHRRPDRLAMGQAPG